MTEYTPAKLYDAGGDLKKVWYVYYSIRGIDGKLHLKKKKAGINRAKTVKQRRRIASIVISELNTLLPQGWREIATPDSTLFFPLKDLLTEMLELKKQSMKWRTWQSFKYCLDKFFAWLDSKGYQFIMPSQFTSSHAHAYADYLTRQGFAPKTFNYNKVNIKHFFTMLQDREIIEKNPFHRIRSQKETSTRHVAFTDKQLKELDKHMKENCYPLYVFSRFILYCFIRPIEILELKISQVDHKNWRILIHGDQAKSGSARTVEIPNALRPLIKKMSLNKFPDHFHVFSKGLLPGEAKLTRNAVTEQFRLKVKVPLKLTKEYSLYGLKHTGNARASDLGISIEAIRRQNGHTTEKQTRTYLRSIGKLANKEFASKMK